MKFVYEYRTSDNVPHRGVVAASNREAAYASLKAQGIRPGFLAEAPGFFNKLFGKGKRWIAIGVLGVVCLTLGYYYFSVSADLSSLSNLSDLDSPVRRQLIGDIAVIEKGIRTGWADVFTLEGDRFLASFAIPGVPAAIRTTTEEELETALSSVPSPFPATGVVTSLEARQIRAIVAGMKREINSLLESGWTLKDVGTALAKRQDREIKYYDQASDEVDAAQATGKSARDILLLWEQKNDELRKLGIKPIPMPE